LATNDFRLVTQIKSTLSKELFTMANLPENFRRNRSLFSDFFRDLDELFGVNFASLPSLSQGLEWDRRMLQPRIEIEDVEDSFIMRCELPGVRLEDIKIELAGQMLNVTAERKVSQRDPKKQVQTQESLFFQRSFSIPSGVQPDQIQAHYENGVLELLIPKAQQTQRQSIEVQSGRASSRGVSGGLSAGSGTDRDAELSSERDAAGDRNPRVAQDQDQNQDLSQEQSQARNRDLPVEGDRKQTRGSKRSQDLQH